VSWAYAVTIDDTLTMDEFVAHLDAMPIVTDWYTCMSHLVFVESPRTAEHLAAEIKRRTGIERLFLADAGHDRAGWLPQTAWGFLERKQGVAKEG
jgi:hypothetical protein